MGAMATPERRNEPTAVPAVPQPHHPVREPLPPLEQTRDFGWLVTVLGAVGSLLGSWTLFSQDGTDGMWAGYWVSTFATAALLGTAWLRTTLPTVPGVVLTAGSGLVLALVGAVRDYPTEITVVMVTGGALITIGAVLQSVRRH